MYAYLDVSDNVVGNSTTTLTLAEAQARIPATASIISDAPSGLVPVGSENDTTRPYHHRKISGDGTDISHYEPASAYPYSVSGDTANGLVATDRLGYEIETNATITTALARIGAHNDNVTVVFDADLSGAEETELDSVVAAHSGVGLRPLLQVAVDPPIEPVVPGASKVVANDRPAIEVAGGATGWAASSLIWPLESFAQAQLRFRIQFILKDSGTGSNVRICGRLKAEGAGDDSSESFSETKFVVVPVTYTTVGEIFETVLWFDASGFGQGYSIAIQGGRDGNNELGAGTDDDVSVPVQIISFCIRGW